MKNLKLILVVTIMLCSVIGFAQQVGKVDMKFNDMASKKFNNTEKKIFIQHFYVHYQTVMVSYAKARGGNSYGSAEAGLALGLDGVTDAQLQSMTDKFYEEYLSKLKTAGFTIVSAEEVKQNENFTGWELVKGGNSEINTKTGYLSTSPTNLTYLNGALAGTNLLGERESNKLGGVIVARVSLVVPFAESQDINGGLVGGVAKITAKADLRVSPRESIPQKGDFKKPITLGTQVSFVYKKNLKWQAAYSTKLKKAIEIEGVLDEKKKYKSTSVSTSGSGFSARYSKAYSENAILVDCDASKYEKGVNKALSSYLSNTVDGFLSKIK